MAGVLAYPSRDEASSLLSSSVNPIQLAASDASLISPRAGTDGPEGSCLTWKAVQNVLCHVQESRHLIYCPTKVHCIRTMHKGKNSEILSSILAPLIFVTLYLCTGFACVTRLSTCPSLLCPLKQLHLQIIDDSLHCFSRV